MTMVRLDLSDATATQDVDVRAVLEENRSLRAYLKKVLELLERQAPDERTQALAVQDAADRLAGLEDGMARMEHDLQTLLWLARGGDRPTITSVD